MSSKHFTPQRQSALSLVAAFNAMDVPAIISHRAPSCTRTFLPSSMNLPTQDNATYSSSLQNLSAIFHNFTLTVNDLVEDREARKICLWLSARADTVAGEYVNEYMWLLEFDKAGMILESREFSDSVMEREFFPKLKEAMERRQAEKKMNGKGKTGTG